jgi:hypothetical protein
LDRHNRLSRSYKIGQRIVGKLYPIAVTEENRGILLWAIKGATRGMANARRSKPAQGSIEDRFEFIGDAVAPGDQAVLRSTMFEVEERNSGAERTLKLWRKTGTPVDNDLRQLWLHEMRQVQRVMSYAGAREVIVDILELVEDDQYFGLVLERIGQPLNERRKRVLRQHWLRNLGAPRARTLFWRNIKRIVTAVGIIHAQGLVHGQIAPDAIVTEGADEPDFKLGGLEWSLWMGADRSDWSHAKIGTAGATKRADTYSFAEDWRALGLVIAECLDSVVTRSGDLQSGKRTDPPIVLDIPERVFLRRLIVPARLDQLDAASLAHSVDDLVASIARSISARTGAFIIAFDPRCKLGEAVWDATNGEIPVDEYRRQLDWVRADFDGGTTLLVPRTFDPATSWLKLVTDSMIYGLRAYRHEGAAVWDTAVCQAVEVRKGIFSLGDHDDHSIVQPIMVAGNSREIGEARSRLGAGMLDWSAFADPMQGARTLTDQEAVRRGLLLVQALEALVKALEVYPVEVLATGRREGRRFVILRAEPDNDRDRIAKRVGLPGSAVALRRLFEDDQRDAEAKWGLSQAASLGATRTSDIVLSFIDVVDHSGLRAYEFESDEELPSDGPFFLRTQRDIGTEQVIACRLRNIRALDTRVDLAEMLVNPWRVRRSSREELTEEERNDAAFLDLDKPKQDALLGLWSTVPSFFVVGPPGVGKTKLATEVIRRRFSRNRSTRMLVSAQGHDALDNLQDEIKKILDSAKLSDALVVRSTTPDRRVTSEQEVHRASLDYLDRLARSALGQNAPASIRDRILELKNAANRAEHDRDSLGRAERSGLGAISNLVLDAANIVISTANSPDIERLVEAREQFDWVVVEEAAKATGPELVGPLMLSGRRLLIGDHHQLPPFDSDRLVKVLSDHGLVGEALAVTEQLIGPMFRDGELDELAFIAADADALRNSREMALKLLEPFRCFVEEDERLANRNPGHRPIVAQLTEQRRMDPAIAEVVSRTFYDGRLVTEKKRALAAETQEPPVVQLGPLPKSPVVVVDFRHVSSTGQEALIERGRPRWHNPSEVTAVIDVLRHLRRRGQKAPSLAVLSPYKAQVDKLQQRIASARASGLSHLDQFVPVRNTASFVGTVDSFQGSEADVVILSLVRNNPRTGVGALGFLRDRRRMNVALSRAKHQLIVVGSLEFLQEAVRGVNPDGIISHDLSFLTKMVGAIHDLTKQKRKGVPLATFVAPTALRLRP